MIKELEIENFLDKICAKYKDEIKILVKNKKYANIILSTNMCAGKIDTKINITINKSEIV